MKSKGSIKKILFYSLLMIGLSSNKLSAQITANFNTSSPAVPFGSGTKYPYGVMPTNLPTTGTYTQSTAAATAYTNWVKTFVSPCSNGALRVRFTNGSGSISDSSYTVSEGIGYGMLLAAYAGDKTIFDGLWKYWKNNHDGYSNYLMNWKISYCSSTSGQNSASDADEDAAMALIIASNQWPNATSPYTYKTEAKNMLDAIRTKDFLSNQMTMGDYATSSGSSCRNPSYMAPGYYKEFAIFDVANASTWNNYASTASTILLGNRNSTTGLVSNWCSNSSPYADNNCNGSGTGYGYDACRNPWRMAIDVLWHGTSAVTASSDISTKLSAWMKGYEGNLKGPLAQNASNPSTGTYKNGVFSTFALSPMASSNTGTTSANLNTCYTSVANMSFETTYYFNATLRTITLFVLTGNFWKPGTVATMTNNLLSENNNDKILIYPNPAKENIFIEIPSIQTGQMSAELYDMNGRKILDRKLNIDSQLATMDINDLKEGIYFLKILGNNFNQTKKIIKIN